MLLQLRFLLELLRSGQEDERAASCMSRKTERAARLRWSIVSENGCSSLFFINPLRDIPNLIQWLLCGRSVFLCLPAAHRAVILICTFGAGLYVFRIKAVLDALERMRVEWINRESDLVIGCLSSIVARKLCEKKDGKRWHSMQTLHRI